jgi:hypothetical protein
MGKFKTDNYMNPEAKPIPTDREKSFHSGDDPEPDDAPGTWGLNIVRTANGYIAAGVDEPGAVFVFEEPEDVDTDPDTMARLLWHVIEYFSAAGSRHDAKRVRVKVEPGDKYEGPTPIEN